MIQYGLGARNLRRDPPVLRSVIRLGRAAARIAAGMVGNLDRQSGCRYRDRMDDLHADTRTIAAASGKNRARVAFSMGAGELQVAIALARNLLTI